MTCLRIFLFAQIFGLSQAFAAGEPPDCAHPQSAADSLFVWLSPKTFEPDVAATCTNPPPGEDKGLLALHLKQVLDARGLLVPVAALSTDPGFVDENGDARVIPLGDFPDLVLERDPETGQWQYSRKTMEAVPRLYRQTFSSWSLWLQSRLPDQMQTPFLGLHLWQYLFGSCLLLVAYLIGLVVRHLLRTQVQRWISKAGLELDTESYRRTNGPIGAVVVLTIILITLPDLQLPISISHGAYLAVRIALILAALTALSRFIDVGTKIALNWADTTESRLDDQLIPLASQALHLGLYLLGGVYLADELGFDVWKLAAGVGIGGLAFALAAQDTVANVFGSLNIFIDKPFQIGDLVKIGNVQGVVEEVGFRSTRVRTPYHSLVTIPNSQITNTNVDNLGARPKRHVKMTLGLTYDTDPARVQGFVEGVRAILATHPLIERSYEVHTYNLGDSAIEVMVHYHVDTPSWHDELVTRSQTIMALLRLAKELDVAFAFPSQSLYLESTPDQVTSSRDPAALSELQKIVDTFGPQGSTSRPSEMEFEQSWSVQARDAREESDNS